MLTRMKTRSNSAAPASRVDLKAKPRSASKPSRTVSTKVSKNGHVGKGIGGESDTSDDEVPLSKTNKRGKAKAARKAPTKPSTEREAPSASRKANETFILNCQNDVEFDMPAQPDVSKASKTKLMNSRKKAKEDGDSNSKEDPTTSTKPSRKPKSAATSVPVPRLKATVILPKPTNPKIPTRGRRVKPINSSDSEPEETVAEDQEPAKNLKGNRKKRPHAEDPEPREEPIEALPDNQEIDPELSDEPPKKGRKNKPAPPKSTGAVDALPDFATMSQGKRGNQNAKTAKETAEAVEEDLLDSMNQLDLNEDQGSKKVGKKKTAARGKAKSVVRKPKQTKDVTSDPKMTMSRFSSMENMYNITLSRGTTVKSLSVDNLHDLPMAQLDTPQPNRAPAFVLLNPPQRIFSESDSENEKKTKKARAPRKKAAK